MAGVDIDTLTIEQYLALSRENQALGVVKPEIGGNVNFEIKSQFMRELREDTFSENKDEDAHNHIDRVLSIVGLFNIPGVFKDAVMLQVFPFTLTGSAKRWVDRLAPGTINTWDLLKKAFIQRYCPPSMTAKQLKDIHNFKQEGDESLYQAWERYNDVLYKCPTHDINSHQKVNIFYKGLSTMNRQLLDSQGPIPGMRPAQALTAIQTIANHSQKGHDGTTSKNIGSSRPRLDKDCPLNEEVKQVEEVRYGEFGRTAPFNGSNGGKFRVGPPGYYTKIDNRPPYGEKRQSLEELLAKHQEEYARRSTEIEETSGLNKLIGVSFISGPESDTPEVLQHRLPPKELNPGSFILPCTIDKFKFYAMTDLDVSKKAPLGLVENVLVKIDKFLFSSDFVIIDNTPFETTILGRPFLATIYAEIDVSAGKISLGINKDRISFDTMRKDHEYMNPSERIFLVDRLAPGTINTWNLLKKAFIQRYCPPSMTVKQLKDIHNFKQEGDESLYQAWERYNDLLYKFPTHDINSHQKVNIFYKGFSTMNRQLLDSQGPIPGMRPAQALTVIQTMSDHSQKWHDETTSKNIITSCNKDGLAALVNKLDNLGRDIKKLKEIVHAIQVGYQICEGPRLDKDCPLNEEVKQVEEVRYGEFRRTSPFNRSNRGKFHVGQPGYYTKIDNRPPYGEKR
ncbi:hypothetical protein Tco_0728559 [Tanacetum coccineum]|uniref:Retrotransposon gag domain-containing protein n=1 Tax=Tanacetum coccineum TaxID=301880 RepID=A0ABQ4YPI5_9ASTR